MISALAKTLNINVLTLNEVEEEDLKKELDFEAANNETPSEQIDSAKNEPI